MEMTTTQLESLPINKKVINLIQATGISTLFPPQVSAFETSVLDGNNLVLAVPTSAGKTLVSEICMLKSILDGRGKALYLVPLRSLAREKYSEFKKYESLGITIAMSIGDYDSSGTRLKEADIVVLTTERADSLVRHRTQWLEDVGIIVVDEVHLVNDSKRGPTLEMVIAKMMQSLPDLQIVALSATISNSDRIADWLNAELVTSTWRPVPLREGVYFDNKISFILDGKSKSIPRRRPEIVGDVVCDILDEKGQALVFVSSRRSTVAVAKKIASSVRPYLNVDAQELLTKAAKKLSKRPSVPEATKTLARVMASGVAFHHAGLDNNERTLVEDFFKDDKLKVVIATPTLAAGVNLPARRVVIRDYRRFEQGRGSYTIPVLEYKQMAGRAGRPKYDKYGEAILIAKSEQERDALTDEYVLAEPERITSKLASPSALRSHLLASIATDMTRNREEVDSLIKGTFFSCQFDPLEIQHHVSSALIFLQDGQLIESTESGAYSATPLGRRASRLYIDPYTAILFRDALSEAESVTPIGALHLICHTPDQQITYLARSDFDEYDSFVEEHKDDFMIEPPIDEIEDYGRYLAEVKTARLLEEWISESSEREITEGFNVGMGDVHRYVQTAEWLVYSASEIARVVNATQHIPFFYNLRSRLKYGVQRELLDLVTLRGIGRIRGRMLYANGLKNQSDLYHASLEEIARVPTVGTSLAKSIKRQLGVEVPVTADETISLIESEDDQDTYSIQTLLEDFEIDND
ncbi:MAG: DEAD/DEAH box helicase [Candidatus Thorarchaeota archaeon]|jgi:helicase